MTSHTIVPDETSLDLDMAQLVDERRGFRELWANYRRLRRVAREGGVARHLDLRSFHREIKRRVGSMRALRQRIALGGIKLEARA